MLNWHPDVLHSLSEKDYFSVSVKYECLIEKQPDDHVFCWYLGLAYLLNGEEDAAQSIWLMAIAQAPDSDVKTLIEELSAVLRQEAKRQKNQGDKDKWWLIHFHLKEINPLDFSNILDLILLEIELGYFHPKNLSEWEVFTLIEENDINSIDIEKLFKTAEKVLNYSAVESIKFAKAAVKYAVPVDHWINMFIKAAINLGYYQNSPLLGIELIHLCLELQPNNLDALEHLPRLYLESTQYREAVRAAIDLYNQCSTTASKFFSNSLLLKSMLSAGAWNEISPIAERHKILLKQLIDTQENLSLNQIKSLIVYTGCSFYLQDNLPENRWYQNEAGKLFYKNLSKNTAINLPLCLGHRPCQNQRLKVGYIAHTLRAHSVGWLSRWLFQHHDRKSFHISLYLFVQNPNDLFFRDWFGSKVDAAYFFVDDIPAAAEKIRDDKIDILIDLDSITLDHTAMVMGVKPAPIQATWLGWDASGLPTMDYFIADPYVLPIDADQHYHEKVLRLPQTYIAVNGFEVDVPTLKRNDLGISSDAVVYYSAQVGMKRHPETIQMQLQIIKDVPNSYLLIKGLSDQGLVQEMFLDLATSMGIAAERLKFLPMMSTEMVHRANLGIADVVLDTFPYNGATTTLETLWMGIPLVTRVGTQFAARNSYAFLMNVGVTEGIAWSAQEYVEWGIRFGCDPQLRLNVAWKLRESRKTSALWNTKQFTYDLEEGYQQMWKNYLEHA